MKGYDADFTLVDLEGETVVRHQDMATRAGWTPFDGRTLRGRVARTVVRGQTVMADGQLVGSERGEPVRFSECLPEASS